VVEILAYSKCSLSLILSLSIYYFPLRGIVQTDSLEIFFVQHEIIDKAQEFNSYRLIAQDSVLLRLERQDEKSKTLAGWILISS
jgi:hypothetical protein